MSNNQESYILRVIDKLESTEELDLQSSVESGDVGNNNFVGLKIFGQVLGNRQKMNELDEFESRLSRILSSHNTRNLGEKLISSPQYVPEEVDFI